MFWQIRYTGPGKQEYQDNTDRIEVERTFSLSKRCYGMSCITTKLEETQLTSSVLSVFVTNLSGFRGEYFTLFYICSASGMTGTDVRAGSCGYLLNQQTLNRNSSTPGTLDNFLRNYNVSAENMEFYISNKTQHGWAPGTSFYHGAYNEYVGSRLAQLDEKYQLSLMLETKTLPEIREQLRLSGQLEMLQADITGLNNELRRANQEGIDLYLTHPNNTNIIDYTEGGTLSHEDAMKSIEKKISEKRKIKRALKVMAVETERRYKYAETFGFVTIYIK